MLPRSLTSPLLSAARSSQICTHLDVFSLLQLSKTSHSFRKLVIAPSFVPVWRAARQDVGLPDLHDNGVKEWHYATS